MLVFAILTAIALRDPQKAIYIAPFLLTYLLRPNWRLPLLAVSAASGLIYDILWGSIGHATFAFMAGGIPNLFTFEASALGVLVLGLLGTLTLIPNRQGLILNHLTSALSVVLFLGSVALAVSSNQPATRALAIVVSLVLSKLLFYFLIQIYRRDRSGASGQWLSTLLNFRPLLNLGTLFPIPVSKRLEGYILELDSPEHLALQTKALKLAIQLSGLAVGLWIIELFYELNSCSDFLGFKVCGILKASQLSERGHHLSLGESWLSLIVSFIYQLYNMIYVGNLAVCLLWLFGFKLPLLGDAPFKARNPLDFFARINFYFKDLIFHFGFFPIFVRLKGWALPLRVGISLFLSLGLFGAIAQLTARISFLFNVPLHDYWSYALSTLISSLATALVLYQPVLQFLRGKEGQKTNRLATLLTVIAFILVSVYDFHFPAGLEGRTKFLLNLFGIRL